MQKRILYVDRVSKFFGGVAANLDVTFNVFEGEVVGLIGPNGAGKTTLFNCISGFYAPTKGEILFDGNLVTGQSQDKLCRAGMCRTWQKVKPLIGMSVLQNVMIGAFSQSHDTDKVKEIARKQLQVVGLGDKEQHFAGVLSIGDKKKLEVARALATKPKLLLLDEICGGLNQSETESILQMITAVKKRGVSIVFIEHDMKAVTRISDRIVVLSGGEKIAEGTPSEVMSNAEVISAYLGTSEKSEDDNA